MVQPQIPNYGNRHSPSRSVMAFEKTFLVKWNEFEKNVVTSFRELKDDDSFKEVTLNCNGRSCKVHRLVISACSPYFETLLKDNPCNQPVVLMKDIPFCHIEWILEFMYVGEVRVPEEDLIEFMNTANRLQIRGLAQPAREPFKRF